VTHHSFTILDMTNNLASDVLASTVVVLSCAVAHHGVLILLEFACIAACSYVFAEYCLCNARFFVCIRRLPLNLHVI
jgi:uncharacterized membrane protein